MKEKSMNIFNPLGKEPYMKKKRNMEIIFFMKDNLKMELKVELVSIFIIPIINTTFNMKASIKTTINMEKENNIYMKKITCRRFLKEILIQIENMANSKFNIIMALQKILILIMIKKVNKGRP